ncbi:helicase [candidate division KSB1 bacterium]|nr:MAG: helicase [candidate division KSB1 bacterium]
MIKKDLLGPAGGEEEEVAEDRVRERYLVGMLAPRKQEIAPEELDEVGQAGTDSAEDGKAELFPLPTKTFRPSSMGMTFSVDGAAKALKLTVRWGQYTRADSETLKRPDGTLLRVWKREQIEGVTDKLMMREGQFVPWNPHEEHPDVSVKGRIRKSQDEWIVTLFLVNGKQEPKVRQDEAWLLQPEIIVESTDGQAVFRKRVKNSRTSDQVDPLVVMETDAMTMLYRRRLEFAVGHGTSVHAVVSPDDYERAVRLETRTIPTQEIPQTTPPTAKDIPALASLVLDMKLLSEASDADLPRYLKALPDAYAEWIEQHRKKIDDPAEDLQKHAMAANEALKKCTGTLARIRAGIALLESNPQAADAFRFANRAMWQQRVRSRFVKEVRKGQKPDLSDLDIPANRSWYPFQLAFILLNLPSVTDLHHEDRTHPTDATADLLWFPTGGGKTEAYLGLTAYTIAMRRLQGVVAGRPGEFGVAVLMRYTLRLLTLQQFQRAATLMCACEVIRREDPKKWGKEPFRIGLWVGMKSTPNTTAQSQEAIQQVRDAGYGQSGTPAQLTSCPWCGRTIDPGRHITVNVGPGTPWRTFIYCGDELGECPFGAKQSPNEGIPALVVDEEIYRHPPALLISTVDKFAQMPWKGQVQMLFGQVTKYCPRHGFRSPEIEDADSHNAYRGLPAVQSVAHPLLRPPDLIIQDELHLINGPLGSLVGLYETAIDALASWEIDGKKVRPKVIASTATIRRAQEQVFKLYQRKLEVFPPHGTDITDNFFAIQRTPSAEYPGRKYLGICAQGKSNPAALIRVYVASLAAAQLLYDKYDTLADPWMTLVGYFNAIRELGGARRLVEDEVSTRLRDTSSRGLANRARRPILEELTSRKSAADIPKILDRLDVVFSKAAEAERKAALGQRSARPLPLDVLIATNMISVGVDVDRLGLMAVFGQPKTTAEYIQSTSRVGRKFPGLVCTIYNWARPRDLSHFEQFEHYHSTFYQHVEVLSVTPFAPRALDRGLSALMVSLIRLASERLNHNITARELKRDDELMDAAIAAITDRVLNVEGANDRAAEVKAMLAERRDVWLREIQDARHYFLAYRAASSQPSKGLLSQAGDGPWRTFTCLNSLRDVEHSINLVLGNEDGLDTALSGNGTQANQGANS